ncbi:hypothetical protein [Actinoplanes sp. NPDC026619]|uniref:hypothetical protein n=1 Tax=Actinoplanes sp. NPDC026619 TaxID=3155798 RepID=UPI0033D46F74
MNHLSTLPTTGEQARHALLLLGVPAGARLVVDVHMAFFDGDLSMAGLAQLMRGGAAGGLCAALGLELSVVPGLVALATWPLDRRIVTPAQRRADELAMIVRVAEFAAMRPGQAAARLLRELAHRVPDGAEAVDLADAARAALTSPQLIASIAAEAELRAEAVSRAARLDPRQQLFGLPSVPHQRGPE